MGISALNRNGIQNPVIVAVPKHMNFRASGTNSMERSPQSDSFDKPQKHTGMWVTLGVITATGLAIGFDFWKYKGQHCKDIWNKVKGIFGKETPKPKEEPPIIKEYSLTDFKKNGMFDKGKALLNDGSGYTGKINHTTKDGHNIVMEYENGLIKSSTKKNGADIIWQKNYERSLGKDIVSDKKYESLVIKDMDGKELLEKRYFPDKHEIVITKNGSNNETIFDTENKRIKFKDGMDYLYDDGHLKGLKSGNDMVSFYPNSKIKRFECINGKTTFYDKKGDIEAIFATNKGVSSNNAIGLKYYVDFPKDDLRVYYDSTNPRDIKEKEIKLNSIKNKMKRDDRLDIGRVFDEQHKLLGTNRGARINIEDKTYYFDDCIGFNDIVILK